MCLSGPEFRGTGIASPPGLIAAAYTAQFKEHGASHTGVLWLSESSQRGHFAAFLRLLEGEDPRASFSLLDAASVCCDYSFASGTFNLMAEADPDDWTAYVKHALMALWERSGRGLAFNLLDADAVSTPQPWLYYTERQEYLDFCRARLSPHVELLQAPDTPDYTLLVRRAG